MNLYIICYINYIDGYVCSAILTAIKILYMAFYKLAINTLQGKTVDSGVF